MKKTLLIAVAAMFVAMGANAQFKRVSQATKFVPQATKVVPQAAPVMMKQAPMDQTEQLVATHVKPVANHRAAADLEGTYILDYADWDGEFTASSTFTITAETGKAKTFSENEAEEEIEVEFDYNLRLNDLSFEGSVIYAIYDEENNTITIPVQVGGSYSTYGDYRFAGLVTVNGEPYNYGYDVVLVVEEDGTLYNYDFAEELAEAGWPEGAGLTGFWTYIPGASRLAYGTTMEFYKPNATMRDNEVHIESGAWTSWTWTTRPVYVEDCDTKYVVHNFFGLCPISIAVDGDKAGIATPVRVMEHNYADEGEDPNYIQIWQWDAELDNRINPGLITGDIVEEDGVKYIRFYETEYKEAWTDPDGTEHEAGNYYIKDYTKWFMVHSTYGDTGAYWWGEARYLYIAIPTKEYVKETLSVEDVEARSGSTAEMAINLTNESEDLTAYQFDLTLPDGISLSVNEKGKYVVSKTSRYEDDSQTLNVSKVEGTANTYRIVCFSMSNDVITGTSGAILNAALTVGESVSEGSYEATITNIVFTKTDGTQLKLNDTKFNIVVSSVIPGDANGDGEVNVSDIVEIVNYIMGKPSDKFIFAAADFNNDGEVNVTDIVKVVSVIMSTNNAPMRASAFETFNNDRLTMVSNSEKTFLLCLENDAQYVAAQFDIKLAEGMRLESISMNDKRQDNHLMTYAKTGENLYKVVIYSSENRPFNDNSGEFLSFKVTGTGNVEVNNILLVTSGETEKTFPALFGGTTDIDNFKVSEAMDVYGIDGILVRKQVVNTDGLEKGLYIINGKKHVVR